MRRDCQATWTPAWLSRGEPSPAQLVKANPPKLRFVLRLAGPPPIPKPIGLEKAWGPTEVFWVLFLPNLLFGGP